MTFNVLTQDTVTDIVAFMGSMPGGRLLVRTIKDELDGIYKQFDISIKPKETVTQPTQPVIEPVN